MRGTPEVRASLQQLLAEEFLEGPNQFDCATCKARCDATRATLLHELPPYLVLQLKRFVYDAKARRRHSRYRSRYRSPGMGRA